MLAAGAPADARDELQCRVEWTVDVVVEQVCEDSDSCGSAIHTLGAFDVDTTPTCMAATLHEDKNVSLCNK